MSPSRALFVIVLLIASAGCRERRFLDNVTALEGDGFCRIKVGDERDNVLIRCGRPCAAGVVVDGTCPPGRTGRCENTCDVYFDVEVCFADGRSVSVRRLDREFDRFAWCFWPKEQRLQQFEPPPK